MLAAESTETARGLLRSLPGEYGVAMLVALAAVPRSFLPALKDAVILIEYRGASTRCESSLGSEGLQRLPGRGALLSDGLWWVWRAADPSLCSG